MEAEPRDSVGGSGETVSDINGKRLKVSATMASGLGNDTDRTWKVHPIWREVGKGFVLATPLSSNMWVKSSQPLGIRNNHPLTHWRCQPGSCPHTHNRTSEP